MRVQLLDNKTVGLFFDYDPRIVSVVKSLPGRAFEPRLKAWVFPVDGLLKSNLNTLEKAGFSIPDEVKALGGGLVPPGRVASPINDFNASDLPIWGQLYPFQRQGVEFCLQGNILLGDKPGLGKTVQALTTTQAHGLTHTLVLTFASLKYQFQSEIKKFFPNARTVVIDGSKKERAFQWKQDADYYIANYELLLRDLEEITVRKYEAILADECTRLSNHSNKQWRALRFVRSDFKIAMTGTAISNSPLDIYGIMEWLRPGLLGNYYSFVNRYVVKDTWGSAKYYKNLDELARRIKPYFLMRTKEQVLPDLPEKIKIDVPVHLSAKESQLYDQIKAELLFDIEKAAISKVESPVMMQNGIVKLMRLRQLCNSMELLGEHTESSKLTALKDLLATLNGGKKIIFTEFAKMADILERELPGSIKIIGDVKAEERDEIVKKFNTDPKCNILIGTKAISYGLNLQAADVIIHIDLPWSCAAYEQRAARSHRMGQKNTVYEYSLIAQKTVDAWVKKKLEAKQEISNRIMPVSELKEILSV